MPSYRALALGKAFAHWQVQPHFKAGDAVYSDRPGYTIREGQLPAALHCGRPLTLVQTAQVAIYIYHYVIVIVMFQLIMYVHTGSCLSLTSVVVLVSLVTSIVVFITCCS
jgi:hypothetical protein